jgi:crotonobetainyl-CoA:carnitine CoA-transferase CaiB-like acyl-CoA transferase
MSLASPLAGVRVLTFEGFGAGPYGSMHLADLGAEVIKIENRAQGGDASRGMGPHFLGEHDSHYFQTFNLNKKSCALDLKHPLGLKTFRRLAATSDAILNNLRGDQPEKLGLTYAALKEVNPKLVCAHISAYGRDNERKAWPGYDYLMQAEAGFFHLTGEPDTPPTRVGLSMIDFMTGTTASLALTSALLNVQRTGVGGDIDVSLFDVALHQLSYPGSWFLNEGQLTTRQPRSAHPAAVPVQLYKTQDGWIFLMCMTEKFWHELVRVLERPDLAADRRFTTLALRRANREVLTPLLDEALSRDTTANWIKKLGGVLPAAPVHDMAGALNSPFLERTGMIRNTPHPVRSDFRTLANPIKLDGRRLPSKVCSALGADTDDLLREVGLTEQELSELHAAGVA